MKYIVMLLIVIGLALADFFTGWIKAYVNDDVRSAKMRKGGLNKLAEIVVMGVAIGSEAGFSQLGRYYGQQSLADIAGTLTAFSVFGYIFIMEVVSILENYGKINPQADWINKITRKFGAYVGSYMYTTTLLQGGTEASDSVFGKIKAAFGENNLLSVRQLFIDGVDSDGNVSSWNWYSTRCLLMNQTMLYGHTVWGGGNYDGYNVGIDKTQLALFSHDTSAINIRLMYWLRDVYNSTKFVYIDGNGYVDSSATSNVLSVRPVFLLS